MTAMRIRIRNMLSLASADISLRPEVLLVCGQNGAGKTTLLQTIASAATNQWQVRGLVKKKDLELLVRKGATEGVVLLEYPRGSVRISYPDGKVEQHGAPPELGTPLGIGAERFMMLPADRRLAEMQARFQTAPTREDFDSWWIANPIAGMDPKAEPGSAARVAVDELWDDIDNSGWDAIAKRENGVVTSIQGRWVEATGGVRWGTQLRLNWAPAGLHRGESYNMDDAIAAWREAKAAFERLQAQAAVGASKRDQLRALAGKLPGHREELADLEGRKAAREADIERIVETLEKDGEPVDPRAYPPCPHCQQPLTLKNVRGVGLVVEKAPEKRPTLAAYEAAVATRRGMLAQQQEKRGEADALGRDIFALRATIQQEEDAETQLAALTETPEVSDDDLAAARLSVSEAEDYLRRVRQLARAIELNNEWERATKIRDAVLPEGIRAVVLGRRTSEISMEMSRVAEAAGMGSVRLDPSDASVWYEERPYVMLSEGEQWRVDFIVAVVMAQREKAKLMVFDNLHHLHPQARPGVLAMLAKLKIPCIVGMTASEPKPPAMPDLARFGLGRAVWLEKGTLEVSA